MSKVFYFLILFLILSCSKNDENEIIIDEPIKMVSESNAWYTNGGFSSFTDDNNIQYTKRLMKYFFYGDTIINNLAYKKLYYKKLDSIFIQSTGNNNIFQSTNTAISYSHAMREESQKVYYIQRYQETEYFYADFDINLGDELNYRWNNSNLIVTEIDSIQIGEKYITRYKLNNSNYFYEGIGCSYGLFKSWEIGIEGGIYLNCFRYDDDKIEVYDVFSNHTAYCPEF